MSAHTPGPWSTSGPFGSENGNLHIVTAENGRLLLAEVYEPDNIPLIAAAPEMLKMLKEILSDGDVLRDDLFNLVARAEGRQP